jgi:hypothetical protein
LKKRPSETRLQGRVTFIETPLAFNRGFDNHLNYHLPVAKGGMSRSRAVFSATAALQYFNVHH